MGVLSDKEVIDSMTRGDIIISPFSLQNLNTSSYDVCLGNFYYEEQKPCLTSRLMSFLPGGPIFNPYSKEDVTRVWGPKHKRARLAEDCLPRSITGIHPSDVIILIKPRTTILAHTEEFIGSVRHSTTMMKARSSFGRSFIEVCKCAGWGDVGYFSRWTMEITNNSNYYSIPLVVGRRIAQIAFLSVGPVLDNFVYSKDGKYQTSSKLDEVVRDWHPSMMLPRLHADRDIGT